MKAYFISALFVISHMLHAQEFNIPESGAYDAKLKSFFISNYGDGNIIRISASGEKSIFQTGLTKSLGLEIKDDILYVVTNLKMIKAFALNSKKEIFSITIEEARFLNDLALDDKGFLYVTDSQSQSIFRVNIKDKSYSLFVNTELDDPNGIAFDKTQNRLVFCYFRENSRIDAVDLNTQEVSLLMSPGVDNLDGIAIDEDGNFLISSWGPGSFARGFSKKGSVLKFAPSFSSKPEVVSTGHLGPADIGYVSETGELIVPLFLEDDVQFIKTKIKNSDNSE